MKFSLCVEPVLTHLSWEDRITVAKDCGFDAVEFWSMRDKNPQTILQRCQRENLEIAAISVCDSWEVRLNDHCDLVKSRMKETVELGKQVNCSTFIGLSGDMGQDGHGQMERLYDNLSYVAELLEKSGTTLVVEGLNSSIDHLGYYLDTASRTLEVIKKVNSPGVKMLYDCYHMQIMEGNLADTMMENLPYIHHIHCAGVPGRHEPNLGEIYYPYLVQQLEQWQYAGYFGLEYWPTYDHEVSLQESLSHLKQGV